MSARVVRTVRELESLDAGALAARPEPRRVLLCTPEHFDVVDVKNPFMEGNAGRVDRARARAEWEALRRAYGEAGCEVLTIKGVEGLEDMVFAANQVLPGVGEGGRPYVLLSRMRHPSRRREVPFFRAWFAERGYEVFELSEEAGCFEGQGDALWHPGRQMLWGGHGPRTSPRAYEQISARLNVPVVALRLTRPDFYHLDTCLCLLGGGAALYFPGAFDEEGRALLARLFPRLVEVGEREAARSLACNAHALADGTVFIQRGAAETVARLRAEGFRPVEVETDEFLKSGGSVFCMKVMVY